MDLEVSRVRWTASLASYWFLPLPAALQDASPQEGPPMDHSGTGRAKEEASSPAPEQQPWASMPGQQAGGEWRSGGGGPEEPDGGWPRAQALQPL